MDFKETELSVAVEEYTGLETVAYVSRYLENRIPDDWYSSSLIQDVTVTEGNSPSVQIRLQSPPLSEEVEESIDVLLNRENEKLTSFSVED